MTRQAASDGGVIERGQGAKQGAEARILAWTLVDACGRSPSSASFLDAPGHVWTVVTCMTRKVLEPDQPLSPDEDVDARRGAASKSVNGIVKHVVTAAQPNRGCSENGRVRTRKSSSTATGE